jgi:hypothetical protein
MNKFQKDGEIYILLSALKRIVSPELFEKLAKILPLILPWLFLKVVINGLRLRRLRSVPWNVISTKEYSTVLDILRKKTPITGYEYTIKSLISRKTGKNFGIDDLINYQKTGTESNSNFTRRIPRNRIKNLCKCAPVGYWVVVQSILACRSARALNSK